MAAVAAIVAARHNRQKKGAPSGSEDGAERRRRFAQKLAMDQRRAAELFDELDEQCHGVITKAQVEVLLRNIVIRHHTFKQEALDYMWTLLGAEEFRTSKAPQEAKDKAAAAAKETQSLIDTTDETDPTEPLPMVEERLFSRVLVLDVVTKMRYYTCHAHDVDVIFEKFDRDKDNYLDANELREALQYIEDKGGNREKYGILIPVVVTSEDVRWVLAQCAHTVSGLINREEAVVAMAIWHHLADDNFAQQSRCCSVQ
ncbi:unnamed protein product [Cladocopium goreaui]|uniref:EF-hand domain-containing protein n=1 Tax=Cladocopium goreaui TaxID=2562237 RepID=A0A9P1BRF8_9DINO|nr:unnamed protein product [Cladocopium goreaui]